MKALPKCGCRVLIVEDDPNLAGILVHQLNKDGYTTRVVRTGIEVGEALHEFSPDLLFLDLMLPGIDGSEICQQIRSDERFKKVKIVGMSASRDDVKLGEFQSRLDDFMPKPFRLNELKDRVVRLIGEIRFDASVLVNNRLILLSRDPEWAMKPLIRAGYHVTWVHSPEEAGFAVGREHPDGMAVDGMDGVPLTGVKIVRLDRARSPVQDVEAALGPVRLPRKPPQWLPWAAAAVVLAAVGVGFVLGWDRAPSKGDPAAPPSHESGRDERWVRMEQDALRHGMKFYEGTWLAASLLGTGHAVHLADGRVLEGLLYKGSDGEMILRTGAQPLKLRQADVLRSEPKRCVYEDYWERDEALASPDAEGHFKLAEWCRSKGMAEAALREFRHALLADPSHAGARREIEAYERGAQKAGRR